MENGSDPVTTKERSTKPGGGPGDRPPSKTSVPPASPRLPVIPTQSSSHPKLCLLTLEQTPSLCPRKHGAAPAQGTLWCVAVPEMVAAVSSASRRSFSSRSFSSSRWCCRCRSSIFFWCVSSMAAKPLSHVACKRDEGKGVGPGVEGWRHSGGVSQPGATCQQVGQHRSPSCRSSPSLTMEEPAGDGPCKVRACPAVAQPRTAPVEGKGRAGLRSDPIRECKFMSNPNRNRSLLCPFCSLLHCLVLYGHLQGGKQMASDSNRSLIPNQASLQMLPRPPFAN